ncbi:MAG: HAD-IA family hydrolase [Betaproteobacteria bacterium]
MSDILARKVVAVLFDLDGTFADTAPDMARALNVLRYQRGLPSLPLSAIRPYVSRGARGMLDIGFGLEPLDESFSELRDAFYSEYQANICIESKLFDGIDKVISNLESRKVVWGIVTNKAARFALPIARKLGFEGRAACIVCGDTTAHTKPHPEPLLYAAKLIGVAPRQIVYVGDDERDIQAAHAAGMLSVAATYGYIAAAIDPNTWGADAWISAPFELQCLTGG